MKKSHAGRELKMSQLIVSPFTQLEQSDAPGEKDLTNLTFDPMRPINSTKRAAFHAWMEDASTESHDAIYAAFQKKVLQNMLSSGGWWFDTVSDSTQLSRLF